MMAFSKFYLLLLSLLVLNSCIVSSFKSKLILRSKNIQRNGYIVIARYQENLVTCSTVISPPKVDKTKKKGVGIEVPISPDLFKESRDIQKEFDNYGNDDKYAVILYNDPFNKRIYVATCLMEVFSWTEEMAAGIFLIYANLKKKLFFRCQNYSYYYIIITSKLIHAYLILRDYDASSHLWLSSSRGMDPRNSGRV